MDWRLRDAGNPKFLFGGKQAAEKDPMEDAEGVKAAVFGDLPLT